MEITMYHYLFIGLIVFLIGLLGSVLVKHVYIMALFYVGLGAVELAVALYIFYLMYQKNRSSEL